MKLNETLELLKAAQQNGVSDELVKAFTQSGSPTTGLTMYDLEAPAKTLYPVITPLRNRIARVGGGTGTAANWKAITAINVNKLAGGVSEGNRGGVIATTVEDKTQSYKGIGFEDYVTFEADMAAVGFDDVKARAVEGLLRSTMIDEETAILGGNSSRALGTTPTAVLSASSTGGAITGLTGGAKTIFVRCVALTLEGFLSATVSGGVPGTVNRTNADGSVDTYGGGSAIPGVEASAVGGAATDTNSVLASVAPVVGAYAYAWFWNTATGTATLGAITTLNSYIIKTNAPTGTQLASALTVDNSRNSLRFDGLMTQIIGAGAPTSLSVVGSSCTIFKTGAGSLLGQMATGAVGVGTPLTADGKGGIVEIDAMLKSAWDEYRLSYDTIYVSAQEAQNIEQKILTGNSNPAFRFNLAATQSGLTGGMAVASYLNKFAPGGARTLDIQIHPSVPAGTIVFYSEGAPYPLSNVGNLLQVKTRREYYQLEWPLRTRKYEYGVYADEMLQCYFPPAFGMLSNVANG